MPASSLPSRNPFHPLGEVEQSWAFFVFFFLGSCRFRILGTDEVDVVVLVMVVLGFLIWFHNLKLLLIFDPRRGILEKGH